MAKKIELQREVIELEKQFFIVDDIKNEGYSADIYGKRFIVSPRIMGQTIDQLTNSRVYGIITESKCFVYDLEYNRPLPETVKEYPGYFADLTKEQEKILKIAGVIL